MKRKTLCLILFVVMIILIMILVYANFFYTKEKNQSEPDTEETLKKDFKEEHYFEDLIIKELNLEEKNGYTTLTFLIYNDGDEDALNYSLKLTFTDKDNKEIANVSVDIGDIPKGENKMFSEDIMVDCINSYDYHFEKN